MKRPDARLRVGLTLAGFTTLAFVLVFSLESAVSWWSGHSQFTVVFPHVQGLRPNDPVQFHGIPCGRVIEVVIRGAAAPDPSTAYAEEISDPGCSVALTLEVPEDVFRHLRTESRAQIEKTLTGVTVVNITQGTGEPLSVNGELLGTPTATIDNVTTELQAAAVKLTTILGEVEPIIRSVRSEGLISAALARVDEAGQEASALAAELRTMVTENREPVRSLTSRAAQVVESLDATIPSVDAFVNESRAVAVRASELAASLQRWVRDRRPSVDASLDHVAGASANLDALSAELRRRPWRLLHAPTELEARELSLYDSVTVFSQGARELRQSIDTLRVLLEEQPGEEVDQAVKKTLAELERHAAAYREFQTTFWEKLQRLYE